MKKTISIILSVVIMLATLMSAVSAGAVYQLKADDKYEPNVLEVFLKRKYFSTSDKPYTANDFPELPIEKVLDFNNGAITLYYAGDSGISMEDALKKIAQNPKVESVFPKLEYGMHCMMNPGDANFDDEINAKDIIVIMKYLVNEEMMFNSANDGANFRARANADANEDGAIDAKDIMWIMKEMTK